MDSLTSSIIIVALVLALIVACVGWAKAKVDLEFTKQHNTDLRSDIQALNARLAPLELKEQARLAHCRKAGAAGRAKQLAAAPDKAKARADATAKTIAELSTTQLRSRAQVVAPVKAKRTKAKNSAAGVDAKQAG